MLHTCVVILILFILFIPGIILFTMVVWILVLLILALYYVYAMYTRSAKLTLTYVNTARNQKIIANAPALSKVPI